MDLIEHKIVKKLFGEYPKDIPFAKTLYLVNIFIMAMVVLVCVIDFYYMMTTVGFVFSAFLRQIGFILVMYFFLRITFKRMWTKRK